MNICPLVFSLAMWPVWLTGSDAVAQGAATSEQAANERLATILLDRVGKNVKVRDKTGEFQGRLVDITDHALALNVETENNYMDLRIPYENVQTVWKQKGNAVTGLLVGALCGTLVGIAVAPDGDALFDDSDQRAMSGILGGLLGTGLGAIIGSQIHSYEMIYEQ